MILTSKKGLRVAVSAIALAVSAFTATAASNADGVTAERADSVNRAVATVMAHSLEPVLQNLVNANLPVSPAEVGRYIAEALAGKDMGMTPEAANAYVESVLHESSSLSVESQEAFIAEAAAKPGAIVTPSGVVFQVITEGEGVHPTLNDQVMVKYVGRFSDGTVFDDTEGETVTFDLASEIPGFVEGMQLTKPGGTYRIVVPSSLAYGAEGIPGIIPGNAALDFTVTLEGVKPSER